MNLHSPFFHLVIMRDHVFRLKRTRLAAFCIFRRSSEKHVSGAVQRSLAGIFQNGDDEADTDDLHGDIIADAEGRTSDRDQEQRAACDAGSTTCTDGRYDAEQECGRQIDIDAQRMCSSQRQHGDRNGCAGHIDRRTERNGDRKDIRIQPESLAERQIHRDIGRRASGEEGIHAAFTDRGEDQWVWIHVNAGKYDDRIPVLTMQALIGAALAGIAFSLPTAFWFQATMCFFFLIAFCSATHDISADGFYMIELDEHTQTKFVGLRNTFYRLAIIFVNGFLVMLAGVLQVLFRNQIRFSWALIFYGLAGIFIGLWLYHSRFMPRPKEDMQTDRTVGEVAHELKNMFRTFFVKFGLGETVCVMLFLLLYRFPEALLNTMNKTFILRPNSQGGLGLSPQEYGFANGTVGLIGLLLGGILGGILVSRDGMKKWLWPLVCAITLPDVVYIYLSYSLNSNLIVVSSCLFVEQLGYGLGFTVLTLYMLFYSQGKFKTSHYSICTGISYLGLMLPGMVSGYLKDMVGYRMFFIIVMACCAITFLVTAFLKIDPNFGKKEEKEEDEAELDAIE